VWRARVLRERDGLTVLAAATALFAAAAATWTGIEGRTITVRGGCAFDGQSYCAMASGGRGIAPFNHRVLVPTLAARVPIGTLATRFRLLDLAALAVVVALTSVLTARIARGRGASPTRTRSAAVLAAAMASLVPVGLHLTTVLPVQTDAVALAFGLAALLALSHDRPAVGGWAPVLAGLAVLSREAWLLPLVATAAVVVRRRPRRCLAFIGVTIACGAFGLTRPAAAGGVSVITQARSIVALYARYPSGFSIALWLALLPCGFAVVLVPRLRGLRRTTPPVNLLVRVCLVAAAAHVAQSLVGGSDISRIAWPAAPLVWAVVVGCITAEGSADLDLAAVVAGSIVVWRPLYVFNGAPLQYLRFYLPEYYGAWGSVAPFYLTVAATVAILLAATRIARARWSPLLSPRPS